MVKIKDKNVNFCHYWKMVCLNCFFFGSKDGFGPYFLPLAMCEQLQAHLGPLAGVGELGLMVDCPSLCAS